MDKIYLCLVLLLSIHVRAELFISTTSSVFTVPEGKVAFITGLWSSGIPSEFGPGPDGYGTVRIAKEGGSTAWLGLSPSPGLIVLAGPLTLTFTNEIALSYRMLTNSTFETLVAPNKTIEVPAGKTLRILGRSFTSTTFIKKAKIGPVTVDIRGDAEIDGPVTVQISQPDVDVGLTTSDVLTYYFTDRAIVLPAHIAIQAATGSSEINVEKSSNLQNWQSAIVIPIANEEKVFYRLRFK